jgi:uncharacterized protein (TIGR02147 family)
MDCHDHLDWRELARAVLDERGLSQRDLAQAADISEGHLSMLLSGRRALEARKPIEGLARALFPTSADDQVWFEALVDLQSTNPRARLAAEAVVRNTLAHLAAPSPAYEVVLLQSDWRANAVLELATCEDFLPDPVWIARQLIPPMEPADAAAVWERLLAADLVQPRADGGFDVRSVLQPPTLRKRAALAAAALHHDVADLSKEAYHRPATERRGAVVTMALSEETAARLLLRVEQMGQELVAIAAGDAGPRNRVFVATLQVFPCSEFTDSADVDQ